MLRERSSKFVGTFTIGTTYCFNFVSNHVEPFFPIGPVFLLVSKFDLIRSILGALLCKNETMLRERSSKFVGTFTTGETYFFNFVSSSVEPFFPIGPVFFATCLGLIGTFLGIAATCLGFFATCFLTAFAFLCSFFISFLNFLHLLKITFGSCSLYPF